MIDQDFSLRDVDSSQVTSEQIGRCNRVYDEQLRHWVWMVQSESSDTEYRTFWSSLVGPCCSCPAGQENFISCRDGICKHVKWIAAADLEQIAAFTAIDSQIEVEAEMLHKLSIDGRAPSQVVAQRIMNAPAPAAVKDCSTASISNNRGFSLLR